MILNNNTRILYKYKIQQYFCSANIFKNITGSKPVSELLSVAVWVIKYTFELKLYKFHLNSRLIKNMGEDFTVDTLTSRQQQRCRHEVDGGIKLYCNFNLNGLLQIFGSRVRLIYCWGQYQYVHLILSCSTASSYTKSPRKNWHFRVFIHRISHNIISYVGQLTALVHFQLNVLVSH